MRYCTALGLRTMEDTLLLFYNSVRKKAEDTGTEEQDRGRQQEVHTPGYWSLGSLFVSTDALEE